MKNLYFCLLFAAAACTTDSGENARAYVEGKITETPLPLNEQYIQLQSEGVVIAETFPEATGHFVLSGPLLSGATSLQFKSKIKSFSSEVSGISCSADSLQLLIPSGKTYITFTEIKLK